MSEHWEDEKTPCDTCKYEGLDCYTIVGLCNNYNKWEKCDGK